MKYGKLSSGELKAQVLSKLRVTRPEVLLTAALGEDCAALGIDGDILISSDPITAAMEPNKLGALLVDVCCNDITANGGEPVALTVTVIMPPDADVSDVGRIMDGAAARARDWRVDIVGGHTEFSDCVTRPIVSGTAVGRAARILKKTDMRGGDGLYVTKRLAMEGTLILIGAKSPALTKSERAVAERFERTLSVKEESAILTCFFEVHMMHDITEGGVLGAVAEVCEAAGLGATVFENALPYDPLTKRLCAAYGIDPDRFLSSGSMLFAASDESPAAALEAAGIEVCRIGTVTARDVLYTRIDGRNERIEIKPDEMYALIDTKRSAT